MAVVEPLRALRYDHAVAGPAQNLVAPPYDVIDPDARARLAARSPFNVVHVDLPGGRDPYGDAGRRFAEWRRAGAVVQDAEPALWPVAQEFTAPDGRRRIRRGFLARVRVEDYGPGRIRAHERTHPAPREDRLRLTRALAANLSPVFSLFSDPDGAVRTALAPHTEGLPVAEAHDDEGTTHRLWRVADDAPLSAVREALADAELLIADGHHRYETARAYAEEVGGEGPHRFVLMLLVALEDEGLLVLPTHRLVAGTTPAQQEALARALRAHFDVADVAFDELAPPPGDGPPQLGFVDAHFQRPFRLTLADQAAADAALAGMPEPFRHLDAAVLEALVLKGPLELTDDDIAHLRRLGYARTAEEAVALVREGTFDVAFLLRPPRIEQVRAAAATGVSLPPKSTFFHPKVPSGLLFHALRGPD